MEIMGFINWVKRILGFGKKKTIVYDIETGGYEKGVIYNVEAYKVRHDKNAEAREALLKKIEDNKQKIISGGESIKYNGKATMVVPTKKKGYTGGLSRNIPLQTESNNSFIESAALGYITDSTVEGTILGGDLLGAMVGDLLNNSDNTPSNDTPSYNDSRGFSEGFGGGDYSGGGAGSDYTDNSYTDDTTRYDD